MRAEGGVSVGGKGVGWLGRFAEVPSVGERGVVAFNMPV